MKYFIFLIIFISYLFSSVIESDKSIFTKEELEWIKNNPVVKIGADANWPPFEFIDGTGKYQGIAFDYLNAITQYTGLKFEIEASDWYSTITKIKDKKLDMLACVVKTPDRDKYLNFTLPYLNIDVVVVGKKELKINSFDEVKNYKIAVQKGNFVYETLIKKYPNIEFVFATSNKEAFELVSYGKADIFIGNMPVFSYFVGKELLTNLEVKFKADFEKIGLSMAVLEEKNILFNIIQKVIQKVIEKEQDKINKKWIFDLKEKEKKIDFTNDEINWIKNNPVVIAGIEKDWAPFDMVNKDNQYSGINKDYFDLIESKSGLKFEYKPDTWSNILEKLQRKEVDILPSMAISEERKKYTLFTNPYFNFEDYAFVHKDNKEINSLEELSKLKICIVKGYELINILKSKYPNIQIIEVNDMKEGLDKVLTKKVDAYIDGYIATNYYLETNMLSNIKLGLAINLNLNKMHFGITKEKPILASIINKSLNNVTNEEKSIILNKWMNKSKDINNFKLTKEEIDWLKDNPVIKISGDPFWPPYSFNDEKGNYIGIIPDLVNEVFKDSNIKVDYVKTNSWSETLNLIKEKKIDLIDAISYSVSRSEYLDFSNKYIGAEIVIIANNKETNYINSFNNITNKNIATVKGYSIIEEINRDFPQIKNIKEYETPLEGLKDLSNSRIDYFILDIPSFEFYSKKYSISNLKIVGPTGYSYKYGFGIKKGDERLISIVNKLLDSVPDSKKDEIYRKWVKVEYEQKIDYDLIWKIIALSLLILVVIVYWNKKLKEQIKQKEKIQQELENERNNIQQLNIELIKAKEIAENVAKQKSEFLANMSHEIRTPMNSVIGFTEILDKEIKDPIQKEYLNSIKKGGNALLRIINDILDLSKIEAGKLEIKNESLNPTNIFLEIESIFHSKIISKNIAFIVDIDKTIPKYIIIDGVRIRQILFNLIGNAIKFTEKGYIKLKVENIYKDNIKSKVDLIFSIEDSGMGIDEKSLNNIFNAFEQQNNQDVAKYGGTGLGLAICTKLVHMMNGEINVKSEKNRGSIFTVILKDIPVSSVEDEVVSKRLLASNIVFEKSQILVVDDVEENRKLVVASLKDFDIDLIMAQNGQEALDKLKNVNVDLILMDLRMPVMNGYEAASIIKNDEKLKKIPLIALTASVMGKDLEKVSKYGFDGYLRKPVILDDLIEELGKYLKYQFLDNDISFKKDSNVIDNNKLKFVINELENSLKEEWLSIKDGGDFSLIEEFTNKLNSLSIEQDIYMLKDYSEELLKNINSFDIEKVDYLMNTYLELIENLKGKLEN